jgi:hypothetical protein
MKKLTTLIALGFALPFFAQEIPLHRCASHTAIDYQESLTPGYKALVNNAFESAKALGSSSEAKNAIVYTIPVVVHVVHNTTVQNIHDSVIIDQIRVLNEDFLRLNADTVNMRSEFDIVKGYPGIEFKLAQIDPNGDPTTGITRTSTSLASFGSLAFLSGDMSDLERVKSTANGGIDPWDQSRYLNIWVCDMSIFGFTALLGYATPPSGLPNWPPGSTAGMSDGVVIQYQVLGSNNPNDLGGGYVTKGRTTTHEVGHYLGLRHIWGDGDCTAQDGIDDTPNADAQSDTDCDPSKNTCTDNIQSTDLFDMIENYMDYSAEDCQNSFTAGQVELMHGVLELQRYDLVHGNPAGLNETFASIRLYPNPASNHITISGPALNSFTLVDMSGKEVQNEVQFSGNQIGIENLNNGVYFLHGTTSSGQLVSSRFIKN